jgi:antitoxin CptB
MALMTPDPFVEGRSPELAPEDTVRRLKWLLENDLLLERFFNRTEGQLSVDDHNGLVQLLDLTDNDLLDLLVGREEPQGELDRPEVRGVIKKIQSNEPTN